MLNRIGYIYCDPSAVNIKYILKRFGYIFCKTNVCLNSSSCSEPLGYFGRLLVGVCCVHWQSTSGCYSRVIGWLGDVLCDCYFGGCWVSGESFCMVASFRLRTDLGYLGWLLVLGCWVPLASLSSWTGWHRPPSWHGSHRWRSLLGLPTACPGWAWPGLAGLAGLAGLSDRPCLHAGIARLAGLAGLAKAWLVWLWPCWPGSLVWRCWPDLAWLAYFAGPIFTCLAGLLAMVLVMRWRHGRGPKSGSNVSVGAT